MSVNFQNNINSTNELQPRTQLNGKKNPTNYTYADMKLERPKVNIVNAPVNIVSDNKFSYKEIQKRNDDINQDIYKGAKREKQKHNFDIKQFFTIFGILAILTAAFSYFKRK